MFLRCPWESVKKLPFIPRCIRLLKEIWNANVYLNQLVNCQEQLYINITQERDHCYDYTPRGQNTQQPLLEGIGMIYNNLMRRKWCHIQQMRMNFECLSIVHFRMCRQSDWLCVTLMDCFIAFQMPFFIMSQWLYGNIK